jgi:hypothetical protein
MALIFLEPGRIAVEDVREPAPGPSDVLNGGRS